MSFTLDVTQLLIGIMMSFCYYVADRFIMRRRVLDSKTQTVTEQIKEKQPKTQFIKNTLAEHARWHTIIRSYQLLS